MYKLVILPSAKQDIKEAAKWYNSRQAGLGKRFTSQVREKINFLKRNPHSIANRYDDVRTAVVEVFPFMVHYTVEEHNKLIIISAVFHTSLNPDIWEFRAKNPD